MGYIENITKTRTGGSFSIRDDTGTIKAIVYLVEKDDPMKEYFHYQLRHHTPNFSTTNKENISNKQSPGDYMRICGRIISGKETIIDIYSMIPISHEREIEFHKLRARESTLYYTRIPPKQKKKNPGLLIE